MRALAPRPFDLEAVLVDSWAGPKVCLRARSINESELFFLHG